MSSAPGRREDPLPRPMVASSRWLGILGAVAGCALMVTISVDVAYRVMAGGSVPGLVDLSETLLVVTIFLGLAYAEVNATHVRMSLLTSRLPRRAARWSRRFSYLITTVLLGLIAWATAIRAVNSYVRGEYRFGLLQWPLWPARAVIPVGVIALLVVTAYRTVRPGDGSAAAAAPVADDVEVLPPDASDHREL